MRWSVGQPSADRKQQQEEAEIAVKANRRELQATAKLLKEQ
jgi:hypothetical protein